MTHLECSRVYYINKRAILIEMVCSLPGFGFVSKKSLYLLIEK